MAKIRKIIDEAVRPVLANDGGGLEILGFQNNVLTVQYQGACGGCPNATAGTLRAIQNLLQSEIDPQITVDSI
jgi:Fe-S cluster biogenesis protein NfuA